MKYGDKLNLDVVIATIREEKRLDKVFEKYKPEIVYHCDKT